MIGEHFQGWKLTDFEPTLWLAIAITGFIVIMQLLPKTDAPVMVFVRGDNSHAAIVRVVSQADGLLVGEGPLEGSYIVVDGTATNQSVAPGTGAAAFNERLQDAGATLVLNALFTGACSPKEEDLKSPYARKREIDTAR